MAGPDELAPSPALLRVVALSGSLREGSATREATLYALAAAARAGATVEHVDLRETRLPFCEAPDRDEAERGAVESLQRALRAADAIILGTPEYHGSYSGVLKNALDLVSADEVEGKVVGLVAVLGGEQGGASLAHLRTVLRSLHAWVVPQEVVVPRGASVFQEGAPTDPKIARRLEELGAEVVRATRALRPTRAAPASGGDRT